MGWNCIGLLFLLDSQIKKVPFEFLLILSQDILGAHTSFHEPLSVDFIVFLTFTELKADMANKYEEIKNHSKQNRFLFSLFFTYQKLKSIAMCPA